jgi:hypothetical protein
MSHIYPPHVKNFFENTDEIENLSNIHTRIAGNARGRKTNVEVLNKSSIVLLTACWEYYIEDLLRESFKYILENASNYRAFPFSVLTQASKELKNDGDNRRVWELAGEGWKKVLEKYQQTTLEKEIDHFHVPRPANIDSLFDRLLGINNITQHWSNSDAIRILNKYIDLRGEIAHNVKTKSSVRKIDVNNYGVFLNRAAIILHNKVTEHIQNLVGSVPWTMYQYEKP